MLNATLCNYYAPCGLCTYYNQPCSDVCHPSESLKKKNCQYFKIEYGKTVCYGTKECEECTCGGDKSKCNFYEKERK